MSLSLEEIRERLTALHRPHQNTRYPSEIKVLVVDYARERLSAGEGLKPIAIAVGLGTATLRSWLTAECGKPVSASMDSDDQPVLLPVKVTALPEQSPETCKGLVLVTPGGYRVEGLDATTASELLLRVP